MLVSSAIARPRDADHHAIAVRAASDDRWLASVAKPRSSLSYSGIQPNARFALSFAAPRFSTIMAASLAEGPATDPERILRLHQSVRLALVRAMQVFPPRQRAALILHDVLEWSVDDVAAMLETTPPAVSSALQRARATVQTSPALRYFKAIGSGQSFRNFTYPPKGAVARRFRWQPEPPWRTGLQVRSMAANPPSPGTVARRAACHAPANGSPLESSSRPRRP
jgi:hypothetical protein